LGDDKLILALDAVNSFAGHGSACSEMREKTAPIRLIYSNRRAKTPSSSAFDTLHLWSSGHRNIINNFSNNIIWRRDGRRTSSDHGGLGLRAKEVIANSGNPSSCQELKAVPKISYPKPKRIRSQNIITELLSKK